MSTIIDIHGGAGPEEAAAIAAVIAELVEEAKSAAARPLQAPRPSPWVQAWRPADGQAPLPSHIYDSRPWIPDE